MKQRRPAFLVGVAAAAIAGAVCATIVGGRLQTDSAAVGAAGPDAAAALEQARRQGIEISPFLADLGPVEAGGEATAVFTVRNTGSAPFNLESILPGCGCTIVLDPSEQTMVFAPGDERRFDIVFNAPQGPVGGMQEVPVQMTFTRAGQTLTLTPALVAEVTAKYVRSFPRTLRLRESDPEVKFYVMLPRTLIIAAEDRVLSMKSILEHGSKSPIATFEMDGVLEEAFLDTVPVEFTVINDLQDYGRYLSEETSAQIRLNVLADQTSLQSFTDLVYQPRQ